MVVGVEAHPGRLLLDDETVRHVHVHAQATESRISFEQEHARVQSDRFDDPCPPVGGLAVHFAHGPVEPVAFGRHAV